MRKIRTLKGKVLVRRNPEREQTRSGLLLPSTARERPQIGSIVASSPENELAVGVEVMFPKFTDRFITLDDEELLILLEDELYITIEEEKKE